MSKLRQILFYLIACGMLPKFSENRKSIQFLNIICDDFDKSYVEFDECYLKAIKRDLTYVNVRIRLMKKTMTKMILTTSLKFRGNPILPPIVQFTVDGCSFLNNKRRNAIAQQFYDIYGLETCSNLNHSCPYDHDIIIDKCRWDDKNIDLIILPAGEYSVLSSWIVSKKPRMNITLAFRVNDV